VGAPWVLAYAKSFSTTTRKESKDTYDGGDIGIWTETVVFPISRMLKVLASFEPWPAAKAVGQLPSSGVGDRKKSNAWGNPFIGDAWRVILADLALSRWHWRCFREKTSTDSMMHTHRADRRDIVLSWTRITMSLEGYLIENLKRILVLLQSPTYSLRKRREITAQLGCVDKCRMWAWYKAKLASGCVLRVWERRMKHAMVKLVDDFLCSQHSR
jgi:hypothetical protein